MTRRLAGYRLPQGGLIDRNQELYFAFNGQHFFGHPGDTLASALIANGVTLISRSLKYHRPRGFYGVGTEDPNSMLAVEDAHGYDPAIQAGQVPLVEGLKAHSLKGSPSLHFDLGAAAQLVSGLLDAGFYYKTFKWPSWRLYEPIIRGTTGFGRLERSSKRRGAKHRHASCDVLIIGAGPAGLATARALRGSGLKVVIADEHCRLGGSLLWEHGEIDGRSLADFARHLCSELAADADFTLLANTVVTGAYENNFFTLVHASYDGGGLCGEAHLKLRARHVVLATGMIDRPLLFAGNDRPGIMLSSSVRRLMGEFAVSVAQRLVIYTNNDSGYLTAIAAQCAGVAVAGLIDTRPAAAAIHAEEAARLGIECYFNSQIESTVGYRRLSSVNIRTRDGALLRIDCDGLANSGGFTPLIHLLAHRGSKPVYDPALSAFVCRNLPAGWVVVGGAGGAVDFDAVLREAAAAAQGIAVNHRSTALNPAPQVVAASFGSVTPQWIPPQGPSEKIWIDLQNDVTLRDIELACRENYTSVEHLKRYTTLGMGTDQGRTSNVNGLAVMAALTEREIADVGTTTFRPPYRGVRMSTVAGGRGGDLFRPRRYLPADAVHREWDAIMEDFGWERPDYYETNGAEREVAVATEMRAVREQVGVFDGSPLGKIEVTGPDAATFLAKFYVSDVSTLKLGRMRYSLMLREDGVIFDDGVVTRLADNFFLASPTSANAEAVADWFERWRQTEWPGLRVAVSPVSTNWAVLAIAGPRARELLLRLQPDFDVEGSAFRHMEFREGSLSGVRARVARVSFTGELQYEVGVPSRYGASLLRILLAAEAGLAPRPIGMEAWLRLRLEKGYLHVGSDTNGRTTPLEVGMASIVAKRQDDFIGKRSLQLAFAFSPEREQLVGLRALDGTLEAGGRILSPAHRRIPCPTEGYVTSACYSPSQKSFVGLALLQRGHQRHGENVSVFNGGTVVRCRVCHPTFYDPANERLHL